MLYIANSSKQSIGGGWSFISNLRKAMPELMSDDYDKCSVYFIASPTMVSRDEVEYAKADGKKVILRIDNAVRNSRNRNTGMTRMRDFAQLADAVVYQSNWARNYLLPFTEVDGPVIINSVDESIFYSEREGSNDTKRFVYSRYNRDETKNWEIARYDFSMWFRDHPDSSLTIIGQFSPELVEGNFDFYAGERFRFLGVQTPDVIASVLKESDLLIAPFYNDACSNTIIEALMCGCKALYNPMLETGGTPEIFELFSKFGKNYFMLSRMAADYRAVLERTI